MAPPSIQALQEGRNATQQTEHKPPPPRLSPFRNRASWPGYDAGLRAGARGARTPSGVKRRALLPAASGEELLGGKAEDEGVALRYVSFALAEILRY